MGSAEIARTRASYIVRIAVRSAAEIASQPFFRLQLPRHIWVMLAAIIVPNEDCYIASDAEKSVTQLPSQLSYRLRHPKQILVMLVAILAGILRDLSKAS